MTDQLQQWFQIRTESDTVGLFIVRIFIAFFEETFFCKIFVKSKVILNLFLWFLFTANSQTNERLSTTESKSNAIASTSSSTQTLTTSNILNTINTTNLTKNQSKVSTKENSEANNDEQQQQNARASGDAGIVDDDDDLASVHLMLEPHLRPAPPDPNSDLSKEIFDEHKQLAKEYLKVCSKFGFLRENRDFFFFIKMCFSFLSFFWI